MKKDNNEQIDIQKLIKEKGIKSIKDLVHVYWYSFQTNQEKFYWISTWRRIQPTYGQWKIWPKIKKCFI